MSDFQIDARHLDEKYLRDVARGYRHDNYCAGDAGFCPPQQARWVYEDSLDLACFLHLQGGEPGWRQWFLSEVQMDKDEKLGREWQNLLAEPIREEVVVLIREGRGYIWDGWHRVGASITSGRSSIKAIVGRPL